MRGVVAAAILAVFCGWGLGARYAGAASAPSSDGVFTPIIGSVLGGETAPVAASDGRHYVVYELLLTNAKRISAELVRIEIADRDSGRVVKTLEGDPLVEVLRNLNVDPVENASLASSESRIALITLGFDDADDTPARLVHRLDALAAASPGAREAAPVRYEIAPLDVSRRTPPVLQSPLKGEGWLAVNGCCDGGGAHRAAIQTVNGALWDAQRFAIDWVRVDDERRLFVGDPKEVENYPGYGVPVYAAADGTVVQALDGLDDQVPGQLPDPKSITLDTVDGNNVVLDHGGGVYTFYAHFQKGSVMVEVGERVRAGQQLALLGNTGNTSAPHLHFQATTGRVPLGSDGIPFVYDAFTTVQRISEDDLDAALAEGTPLPLPTKQSRDHVDQIPMDLDVITFP